MYHTLEIVRKLVAGRLFACIHLYSYNAELLDVIITPQTDIDSIVMMIDTLKQRHAATSIRIATDIREILKEYVMIPGFLALYSTQAELSRPYRMLDERDQNMQMALEIYAEEPEEQAEILPVQEEQKLTLWGRLLTWLKNLIKR